MRFQQHKPWWKLISEIILLFLLYFFMTCWAIKNYVTEEYVFRWKKYLGSKRGMWRFRNTMLNISHQKIALYWLYDSQNALQTVITITGDEYVLIHWWFFGCRHPSTKALHFLLPIKKGLKYYHQMASDPPQGWQRGASLGVCWQMQTFRKIL